MNVGYCGGHRDTSDEPPAVALFQNNANWLIPDIKKIKTLY